MKPGNQQQPKQTGAQKEGKEAPASAKKGAAESQKGAGKSKPPTNTANNAGGDKGKKKSKSKKKNDSDEENNPSLALHIDLKNFPETEKSALKRLKWVVVSPPCIEKIIKSSNH